jgi:hypothetical protein
MRGHLYERYLGEVDSNPFIPNFQSTVTRLYDN